MCIRLEIVQLNTMDEYTRNNWAKVRKALKEAGKTDSFLYRQSVSVTEGRGLLDKEPSWIDADAMAKELMDEKDG
jgi:hypothetical protein